MIIEKYYQLWKVASKDNDRPTLRNILVTHWPFGPSYFIDPSHGNEFPVTKGAFYREDNGDRLCTCADCQHAHAKQNGTPDSPFNQGDVVCCQSTRRGNYGRIGVVYQTNPDSTRVDYPHLGGLAVRYEKTSELQLCWARTATPAVDVKADNMISNMALEDHMNKHYGVAVATNGFALAMVPVEIESDADLGMFDSRILMQAHRVSRAKTMPLFLRFGKHINGTELVLLSNGHLIPRERDGAESNHTYPDYAKIIPRRRPKAGEVTHGVMTYDPKHFNSLVDAIGGKQSYGVRAVFAEERWATPILMEPTGVNDVDELFKPPLGLLMPVSDGPAQKWYRVKKIVEE